MKTMNYFFALVAATFAFNVAQAAEASDNLALLNSPRYLEKHPGLLREHASASESKPIFRPEPTDNAAVANSPRYLERNPEFRWSTSNQDQQFELDAGQDDQLSRLTENKAVAASPRYLEKHPELIFVEP